MSSSPDLRLSLTLCVVMLAGLWPGLVRGESLRLPVVQDNSIVMVDGEWSLNAGSNGRIRIKGNQHIVVMSFDVSAIRGRRVKHAELICHASAESISGVSISTIATPWDEMTSTGLSAGTVASHSRQTASTANEPASGRGQAINGWGTDGTRFPAVAGGNSFTLVHRTEAEPQDGVYRWDVPADMVHALATGVAFGLAIHEHDADYGRNPTIYSREQSGRQPVLLVELDDQDEPAPQPVTDLQLVPVDATSARLTLQAPVSGFACDVSVDGVSLPRHNIPLLTAGERLTIPLRDLPDTVTRPGRHSVEVVTISRTGQRSQPAVIEGDLFHFQMPVLPDVRRLPSVLPKSMIDGVAIVPVLDRYDRGGHPVGDLPADYRWQNSLFDGRQIRLTAAAGEVVSFQALLRGAGDVSLRCRLDQADWRIDLFQAVYVPADGRLIPDPLLPLPEKLRLSSDNDQAVFADIFVPFDARAGRHAGTLEISDGRKIPLDLEVLPVQLPHKASFLCEMNGYGLPDRVDEYYSLQQVAYDHRVHLNILHYSHHTAAPGARKSNLDMRLSSGRRMDNRRYDSVQPGDTQAWWDDFAEAFGPILDGSYFRDGHRGPVAAPGFYLTFHESWPLNCRAHFNGDPDAYRAFQDSPAYATTYTSIVADFVKLARQQGWSETGFQIYFNNKGSLGEPTKAPWILDEPAGLWDYRALQFYGELTDRGRGNSGDIHIDYRIDISRPEYCRGQLDRRSDLWVVSSSAFQNYRRLVTDRQERDGLRVWVYGTASPVHESSRQLPAWALDAWKNGATGLVPWQTVDKTGQALKQADQLGLFIFDKASDGSTIIRHSARLKAFRDAEQLIEYLHLVQQRQGWSTSQMRVFIDHYVPLTGQVRQRNDDDAGTAEYDRRGLLRIDSLRQAAIALLRE